MKAQEIADRFNISLRTVYRDIKTLGEAGVPLIGEPGSGYSIMSGYRLPPVMFTQAEALAFVSAEKLVEKFTDIQNATAYQSALFKVKAVLRTTDKELLENIDTNIQIVKTIQSGHLEDNTDSFQKILKGIADRSVLFIHYFSHFRQMHTERHIEPVGIYHLDTYWYLVAYCQVQHDYRTFRMDRITHLAITGTVHNGNHPSLKQYLSTREKNKDVFEVEINIDKYAAVHMDYQKYYYGLVAKKNNNTHITMSFITASLEGFARWYLMFADHATIIKPLDLKERVKQIIADIPAHL